MTNDQVTVVVGSSLNSAMISMVHRTDTFQEQGSELTVMFSCISNDNIGLTKHTQSY